MRERYKEYKMWKIVLLVLVVSIVAFGFWTFSQVDVEFIPGQSNAEDALDVIVQVQDSVKDAAGDMADTVGRDSIFDYDAPEGLASKLWKWAKSLMSLLGTGIVLSVSQFDKMGIENWQKQEAYSHKRKMLARKAWFCAKCGDKLPIKGFVWKARFENFIMRYRFQDCTSGLYCDYCVGELCRH